MDVNIKEQEWKSTHTDRPSNFKIGVVHGYVLLRNRKNIHTKQNHITRILEINR